MLKFRENLLHLLNKNCFKFDTNPTMDLGGTTIWNKIPEALSWNSFHELQYNTLYFRQVWLPYSKPSILRVSSFCQEKLASWKFFLELFTRNSSSRIQKNSFTGSIKASASMVGEMFAVVVMSYWRERFIKVGTGFWLLGIVPWCAWQFVMQLKRWCQWLWHKLNWGFGWRPKYLENVVHKHRMFHSAHNGPIFWMQSP